MTTADFEIRLVDRAEVLKYVDAGGTYGFNVFLHDGAWDVILPGSHGESRPNFEPMYYTTPEERARILPRISAFLSRFRFLGDFFTKSYKVRFVDDPTPLR